MAVNWNLLQPADIAGSFQQGVEQGRQRQAKDALSAYAQNPGDVNAYNDLARFAPETAIKLRNDQQEWQLKRAKYEQDAGEYKRKNMAAAAQLFDPANVTDEASYQRAIAIAREMKFDMGDAPATYDPTYVGRQHIIASVFAENPDRLTSEMRNIEALGYKRGTPEFEDALASTLNAKYAQPYIGSGGETRLSTPNLMRPAMRGQQGGQPQGGISANAQQAAPILRQAMQAKRITREELARVQGSFGSEGQLAVQDWIKRNNIRVIVRTGTAPDGRRVAEYEDGTVDYAD